ncbi:MAG: polyamine aminopropyltransferase [Amphritea sp.]
MNAKTKQGILWGHDLFLISIMAVLAACGLIYEYLLAHYAGRVLGAVESTIYSMIGIMIVAMGVGAFLAKWVTDAFSTFIWLEISIALLGGSAILLMSGATAIAYTVPSWLGNLYGLDPQLAPDGGVVHLLQQVSRTLPFFAGFILGLMIGMEIPLIARIRETLYGHRLLHNTGTIYGADYIGAGIGAAIWVIVCLNMPIVYAAVATAGINAVVGVVFLYRYRRQVSRPKRLWTAHILVVGLLAVLFANGVIWMENLSYSLFKDEVVYSKSTKYQQLTLTQRIIGKGLPTVTSLYINGHLQFSSSDESIYHSFLTYPALLSSARQEKILIIGAGDGLAVRDVLRWQPKQVTLIDLDPQIIELFSGKDSNAPESISETLLQLNQSAFLDPRVSVITGDAFIEVESLVSQQRYFDTIIVDLPDPSHPDLNKLYSDFFYSRLKELLNGDGVIAIQSTSPFHAKKAFISIGKTLSAAGYITEQYHANVPTFGEWGWTIGVKRGLSASKRIAQISHLPVEDNWISKAQIQAAFVFSPNFYNDSSIESNRLGSHRIYNYHRQAWEVDDGVFFSQP